MKFENKFNMLLEGETVQENYVLLSPFNYHEALLVCPVYPSLLSGKKLIIEWCEITEPKKFKDEDIRSNNLHPVRSEHVNKIPDEIKLNWEKCYIILGRDIMYKYGLEVGDGIAYRSYYKVLFPKAWKNEKDALHLAYLKPSNFSSEVKDTFGGLYS